MLISLVVVMNYLPRRLEQSTKALLKIQSEIFFARRKIDLMNEEHIHQLLGILQKLEGSEKRNGTSIATLESNALELIKM